MTTSEPRISLTDSWNELEAVNNTAHTPESLTHDNFPPAQACDDYAPDTLNPDTESQHVCSGCLWAGVDHVTGGAGITARLVLVERDQDGMNLEGDHQLHLEGCADIVKFTNKPNFSSRVIDSIVTLADDEYSDLASDYSDPDTDGKDYFMKACINECLGYVEVKPCCQHIVDTQTAPYNSIVVTI